MSNRLNKAIVALIALAASVTSLGNGFVYDDLPIIANNRQVHDLSTWWTLFGSSYWPPQYGESLYRPVSVLSYGVQWAIGNGNPLVFHSVSVVLYILLSIAVLFLLREWLDEPSALAGAALFAAHPLHTEAVANVVGQAELLAGLGVVSAVVWYVRARRAGGPTTVQASGIAALYVFAALCKEHALLLPLLLGAAEMLVIPRAPDRRRAGRQLILLLAVGALILSARIAVLGSLFGEQNPVEMDLSTRLWTMLRVAPEWIRLLVWPAHLSAEYGPQQIEIIDGPSATSILGLMLGVIGVISLVGAWSRNRVVALGILWMAIAILPVSNLASGVVLQERTLMLASVGFVVLVGASVQWLTLRMSSPVARRALASAVLGLTIAGTVHSARRNPVWRDNLTFFTRTVHDAPRSYRAHYVYGMELFNVGRAGEGERELRRAIALSRNDSDPYNFLATKYREARLYPQAIPLYRSALAIRPSRPDSRFGLAWSLLETGDAIGARAEADTGLAAGQLKSYFDWVRSRADSVLRTRAP